ncbi:hypothetical protein PPROV_000400100 [Pycnococcus provasolii]|uniref:Uncharacterized protein n=1 Tax=Pycnococcus provasolii TaxID=41880 RepID=A0A830HIY9_9CHLO|nr:hypothetical protein PPROV_000400100 [Pycnococcus provasolii]
MPANFDAGNDCQRRIQIGKSRRGGREGTQSLKLTGYSPRTQRRIPLAAWANTPTHSSYASSIGTMVAYAFVRSSARELNKVSEDDDDDEEEEEEEAEEEQSRESSCMILMMRSSYDRLGSGRFSEEHPVGL